MEGNARPRQLLIGIDACDWGFLQTLVAAGRMPNLGKHIKKGTRARLATPTDKFGDTAWAAIHASATPAQVKKYFDVQYQPASQSLKPTDDEVFDNVAFWDCLSDAGLRVGVLDAPKFRISEKVEGFQVGNWGACSTKTPCASTPPDLMAQILGKFGPHPVQSCDAFESTPQGHRELFDALMQGVRLRAKLARWLMNSQDWDVFFVTFSEAHCAGHHLWHYQDPSHHLYSPGDPYELEGALAAVYEAVDDELGTLFELAGEDALRVVLSPNGMGPLRHISNSVGQIVELLGFGQAPGTSVKAHSAQLNWVQRVKQWMPVAMQLRIKAMMPAKLQEKIHVFGYTATGHWEGARAFAVPNFRSVGAIRINVKGRDKFGVVEPGEAYEALCNELVEAIGELRDERTGKSVVRDICIIHRLFSGPFLDGLPDVTFAWDQSFPWSRLSSPRFGILEIEPPDGRSGAHNPDGFWVCSGPNIPADQSLEGCTSFDVAPTVLSFAGLPTYHDFTGKPIPVGPLAEHTGQSGSGAET